MDPFPSKGHTQLQQVLSERGCTEGGQEGGAKKWWDGSPSVATHTDMRKLADIGLTMDDRGQ
jgi:hypothetical protein